MISDRTSSCVDGFVLEARTIVARDREMSEVLKFFVFMVVGLRVLSKIFDKVRKYDSVKKI